jgi:hypothetical protein
MTDIQLQRPKEILNAIAKPCDAVTLEEWQTVFLACRSLKLPYAISLAQLWPEGNTIQFPLIIPWQFTQKDGFFDEIYSSQLFTVQYGQINEGPLRALIRCQGRRPRQSRDKNWLILPDNLFNKGHMRFLHSMPRTIGSFS